VTYLLRTQPGSGVHPSPVATPAALAAATASPTAARPATTGPAPGPSGVSAALAGALADPALGGHVLARVVEADTGTVLYAGDATTGTAPASTAKLLTAAAVLSVHARTDRFRTSVVAGPPGTVVLVGGGDPTLTAAPAGTSGAYAGAARISDLAAQLAAAKVDVTRIVVDGSLFDGPQVSPDWVPGDAPSSYASPITALMVDGGRDAPGDTNRSAAPDLAAGRALAAALGRPDLPVARGTAPAGAARLATVESAPVSQLVEQMLQLSDNVIAECLGRQVALAQSQPATFTGAASAIRAVLARLGVDVGTGMRDASGLAPGDRLTVSTLTDVLRLVAGTAHPELRPVLTGLPVAAWSGTLADRYLPGTSGADGAGVVRAKTGTINAVSALAGLVHDRDGHLLAFAFIADRVALGDGPSAAAEAALDAAVARLADCGCS
jgi:D-alanyl-D-alanine carboxypeptidase/D-alanyl-D-alanine-endopeptidase (penicillin-binding protein 4)